MEINVIKTRELWLQHYLNVEINGIKTREFWLQYYLNVETNGVKSSKTREFWLQHYLNVEINGIKTHEFWYLQLKTLQMPDLVFFIIESMSFRLDQVFFKAKTIYYDK